ncbi:VIT1/CCC1 transporter family protein [Cellulomonas biazotea]|uniref:Membrane protein n=1 Tax=Cellulomonas biazotea TaxID=1709 RepID=A0A402DTX9_9CELL|nr:VIT1/CCC1 transporter family protein [Cellulomonas biazotea]GCE77526.1 membrane protein [Cellulomonas biazotea]
MSVLSTPFVAPPGAISAGRLNRLRAAVLGANDGIVSIAAMVVGVAGAAPGRTVVVTAGIAGLVAGALSMAAGEYVSVSSQRDAERAGVETGALDDDAELTNPWHAAFASLGAFLLGGLVPLLAVVAAPSAGARVPVVAAAVVAALVVTGAASARAGGAPVTRAVTRNVVGGGLAMAVTYGVGSLVGLAL